MSMHGNKKTTSTISVDAIIVKNCLFVLAHTKKKKTIVIPINILKLPTRTQTRNFRFEVCAPPIRLCWLLGKGKLRICETTPLRNLSS